MKVEKSSNIFISEIETRPLQQITTLTPLGSSASVHKLLIIRDLGVVCQEIIKTESARRKRLTKLTECQLLTKTFCLIIKTVIFALLKNKTL